MVGNRRNDGFASSRVPVDGNAETIPSAVAGVSHGASATSLDWWQRLPVDLTLQVATMGLGRGEDRDDRDDGHPDDVEGQRVAAEFRKQGRCDERRQSAGDDR